MKLNITSFRGATSTFPLEFDPEKPVCVLFGENGTGKSTIVDAFDVVCNGRFGSVGEYSGTNPGHAVSLNAKPATLKIELEIDSTKHTGKVISSRIERNGLPGCPVAHILRRTQLLRLLVAQPAKRYEELKNFIDLSLVESAETGLREALNQLELSVTEAEIVKKNNAEVLQKLQIDHSDKPKITWEAWAAAQSCIDTATLAVSLNIVQTLRNQYDALGQSVHECKDAAKALGGAIEKISKAQAELLQKSVSSAAGAVSISKLLQETQKYLQTAQDTNRCPVCEQDINRDQLAKRIHIRLTELEPLVQANEEVEKAEKEVVLKQAALAKEMGTLFDALGKFDAGYKETEIEHVKRNLFDWDKHALPDILNASGVEYLALLVEATKVRTDAFFKCRDKLADDESKKQAELVLLSTVKESHKKYVDSVTGLSSLETQVKWAAKLLALIEKHRKTYSDALLKKISTEVQTLFSAIHPGEKVGGLALTLDPVKKGSVNVSAEFYGPKDVPPQAYYSESHLDTLGLCVFIAIALERTNPEDILILDDVLSSCDQQHIDRVIMMLEGLSDKFSKIIITTHYRPWRERYRVARAMTVPVQLEELLAWTLPIGIRHASTKLSVEELEEVLNMEPVKQQDIASKAGILLEAILDHISLIYRCKLPYKTEKEFVISEYLGGFDKKLKTALKIEKANPIGGAPIEHPLIDLFDYVDGEYWVRNKVGCHFTLDSGVSDAKVKEFGQKVIEFAEIVTCSSCGSLPYRNKDGSTWACKCGALKLHPHTQPS
jgi:hypothetical protein